MTIRILADQFLDEYRHALRSFKDERIALKIARKQEKRTLEAQEIIVTTAQKIQQNAHTKIADLVTRCLAAVFKRPYKFVIDFERKRGKTNAKLTFMKKVKEKWYPVSPLKGAGGGAVDVAAFALRLACLMIQKPRRRKLLILDEPFKFVSERKQYREKVRNLIISLSEELNVQFILVTHDEVLEIGKVVNVGRI